jgi:hypothetical protein
MVLALSLAVAAYADAPVYDLCIEQSPAKAGTVTPDSGTHRFSANALVALAAEPQPGYQFAYWLGDVADPTARQTTVHVNSSKIIVAVFRPEEKDPLDKALAGGGGGILTATPADLSSPAWSSPGGKRDTSEAPTIHTPEPATLALLALGGLVLRRRRR